MVYKDVLPGDSHATAMKDLKGEFGLRTSPGLLKVMFAAIACRKIRIQRRLLGLGAVYGQRNSKKLNNLRTMSTMPRRQIMMTEGRVQCCHELMKIPQCSIAPGDNTRLEMLFSRPI